MTSRQVKVTIVTSEFQGFLEKSEQAYRLIGQKMKNNHRKSHSNDVEGVELEEKRRPSRRLRPMSMTWTRFQTEWIMAKTKNIQVVDTFTPISLWQSLKWKKVAEENWNVHVHLRHFSLLCCFYVGLWWNYVFLARFPMCHSTVH